MIDLLLDIALVIVVGTLVTCLVAYLIDVAIRLHARRTGRRWTADDDRRLAEWAAEERQMREIRRLLSDDGSVAAWEALAFAVAAGVVAAVCVLLAVAS